MSSVFDNHCEKLVDILGRLADTQGNCDMFSLFNRFTLDSIGEIAFGTSIGAASTARALVRTLTA